MDNENSQDSISIRFLPQGVCSKLMSVEIDPQTRVIKSLKVIGGCQGNAQGICRLVQGMAADIVAQRFSGIRCGTRPTSCPDQISIALQDALDKL